MSTSALSFIYHRRARHVGPTYISIGDDFLEQTILFKFVLMIRLSFYSCYRQTSFAQKQGRCFRRFTFQNVIFHCFEFLFHEIKVSGGFNMIEGLLPASLARTGSEPGFRRNTRSHSLPLGDRRHADGGSKRCLTSWDKEVLKVKRRRVLHSVVDTSGKMFFSGTFA